MAQETGQSMQAVIEAALDAYRRDRFFEESDAGYEALWADPQVRRRNSLSERFGRERWPTGLMTDGGAEPRGDLACRF